MAVKTPVQVWFSAPEAAEYIGKNYRFLQNHCFVPARDGNEPLIPFYRIGRYNRFRLEDLDAYLAYCRVGGDVEWE